ncbi:MAG: CoA-binding protein [Chloroflexi bacterium]|nr:CoA-binding protein [Chloroflexota bacterium]
MDATMRAKLDRAFNPRVVAVVGAKKAADYSWLRNQQEFQGKVYSVQIDPNEIPGILELGFTNLSSLKEVPEPIDYVICAVPRNVSPRIVQDCTETDIGGVTLFTSGFAETQTEEGVRFQERITQMARAANLALVGPNCMGIYNPRLGLKFGADQPFGGRAVGGAAFLSQSGSQASGFIQEAYAQGVGMSKVVSFGNGVVLEAADYLEYFAEDPDTSIIGAYIEGVRDGQRFVEVLRRVTAQKPVVIWKGGVTEDAARATRSHTASLAVPMALWEAIMRQCNAILVHGVEEMVDTIKALQYTKPLTSGRMGLIAVAGGHSVEMADCFSREGLRVPALSERSYEQLASWFNTVGGSYRNPLEGGGNLGDEANVERILNILEDDENVDAICVELGGGGSQARSREALDRRVATLVAARERLTKPLWAVHGSVVLRADTQTMREVNLALLTGGVPAFDNFTRAARALYRFIGYSQRKLGED